MLIYPKLISIFFSQSKEHYVQRYQSYGKSSASNLDWVWFSFLLSILLFVFQSPFPSTFYTWLNYLSFIFYSNMSLFASFLLSIID